MLDQTIVTYCICNELCRGLFLKDDPQCKMSTPEVMTFAILAASMFYCDYRRARLAAVHDQLTVFSGITGRLPFNEPEK